MKKIDRDLFDELIQSGVLPREAAELTRVAGRLTHLATIARSESFKKAAAVRLFGGPQAQLWPRFWLAPALAALVLLLASGTLVAAAQTSLPGEQLYAVKRASEKVAVTFVPNLAGTIVVRRSEEVHDLVIAKKNHDLVKEALAEYEEDLPKAKEDRAKVEESRQKLEVAHQLSSEKEKEEIEKVLRKVREKEDNEENKEDKESDSEGKDEEKSGNIQDAD